MLFTASDFTPITSHIHSWALLSLWLCLFILSGVISSVFSSSILSTSQPGEFIFQHHIFLPFHTVHWILKASILKWFAISFSSGLNSPPWPVCLGWPYMTWLVVSLSYTRLWSMWSVWLVFCDCGFHSICPLVDKDKRLVEAPWLELLALGQTGLALMGKAMLSRFLIQFSADGWGCVPSL